MKTRSDILLLVSILAGPALAAAQWFVWFYAPVERTMGLVQKIFYFHIACAWWSLFSFFLLFLAGIGYLASRRAIWDRFSGAAAEVGVLLATLALVTGSIWAKAAWGVWWTWDPRLSTTLIMWFVYCGYLVLRGSNIGGERRSLVLAVVAVVAFLDVPLVFFSARMWRSIHPAVLASKEGGLAPEMLTTMLVMLAAFGFLWAAMLWMRYRLLAAREIIESRAARLAG
jgi:heme exporter protein C